MDDYDGVVRKPKQLRDSRRLECYENYYTHVERRKDPLSIDAALGKKGLEVEGDKKNMANAHA